MRIQRIDNTRQYATCQRGSVAIIAAVTMTALVVGAGIAVDYGSMVSKRSTLQAVADAASIATAREMTLANAGSAELEAVANNMVSTKVELAGSSLSVAITIDEAASSIEIAITEDWSPYFAHLFSNVVTPITARAKAKAVGSEKICVLALDETASGAISLNKKAKLEAQDCGVYSNSTDAGGIEANSMSLLTAKLTCSAGGVNGAGGNFAPYPTTDCPPVPDPLIDRQPPTVGGCDETNLYVFDWQVTLQPGVYCGGLSIGQNSQANFEPGVYVIKDGTFTVSSGGAAIGENVSFYLLGDNATFEFTSKAKIELTAPKDGEMAGILFFEDRNSPLLRTHSIFSDNARILLGTIYLPNGRLLVKTAKPVADQSAYTAIVARQVALDLNPTLVLNSDYGATDIPVPGGLAGTSGRIVLSE